MIFNKLKKKVNEQTEENSVFEGLSIGKNTTVKKKEAEAEGLSGLNLPDHYVAIPHYLSQSAIYAPRSGDRTVVVKRMDLWSQGNMNVAYEGPLLDTKIDSRLMSLVLKARDLNPNADNIVKLKYKDTMKLLGMNPHHPNSRKKFNASIARHLEAKFYFCLGDEKAGFWRNFFVSEGTIFNYEENYLHIKLSEVVPVLFKLKESGSFSIEDMLLSFATKSSYATKLYSYYESNENPFPVKVSTLLEICDKKLEKGKKPTNNHRRVIKEALEELVKLGFLKDWKYNEDQDKRDPMVVISKISKKERLPDKESKNQFSSDYIYEGK